MLESELDRVRRDYNGVRLHQGIGDVTPNDEHASRASGEPTTSVSPIIAESH